MCGIVGYIGNENAGDVLLDGLRRLEYRGYDSAGVAVLRDNALTLRRSVGKLSSLEALLRKEPVDGRSARILVCNPSEKRGTFRPRRLQASAREEAGPPEWVRMAMFLPLGTGWRDRAPAHSKSSSTVPARITPACPKRAS